MHQEMEIDKKKLCGNNEYFELFSGVFFFNLENYKQQLKEMWSTTELILLF